jgi:hypothetical protein
VVVELFLQTLRQLQHLSDFGAVVASVGDTPGLSVNASIQVPLLLEVDTDLTVAPTRPVMAGEQVPVRSEKRPYDS